MTQPVEKLSSDSTHPRVGFTQGLAIQGRRHFGTEHWDSLGKISCLFGSSASRSSSETFFLALILNLWTHQALKRKVRNEELEEFFRSLQQRIEDLNLSSQDLANKKQAKPPPLLLFCDLNGYKKSSETSFGRRMWQRLAGRCRRWVVCSFYSSVSIFLHIFSVSWNSLLEARIRLVRNILSRWIKPSMRWPSFMKSHSSHRFYTSSVMLGSFGRQLVISGWFNSAKVSLEFASLFSPQTAPKHDGCNPCMDHYINRSIRWRVLLDPPR